MDGVWFGSYASWVWRASGVVGVQLSWLTEVRRKGVIKLGV